MDACSEEAWAAELWNQGGMDVYDSVFETFHEWF